MALRVKYVVTSEHPCQIPVLGTFEAGETKEVDESMQSMFEANLGYKLGASRFPSWVRCVAILEEVEDVSVDNEVEGAEEV